MSIRVGIGSDTHAFAPGIPLWVAGLEFPGEPAGLRGPFGRGRGCARGLRRPALGRRTRRSR